MCLETSSMFFIAVSNTIWNCAAITWLERSIISSQDRNGNNASSMKKYNSTRLHLHRAFGIYSPPQPNKTAGLCKPILKDLVPLWLESFYLLPISVQQWTLQRLPYCLVFVSMWNNLNGGLVSKLFISLENRNTSLSWQMHIQWVDESFHCSHCAPSCAEVALSHDLQQMFCQSGGAVVSTVAVIKCLCQQTCSSCLLDSDFLWWNQVFHFCRLK